jgi:hypothetical protein
VFEVAILSLHQHPQMPQADLHMSAIEYYHIDLGTHEVIYAERASVDSYFDDGSNRESFSNFVQYERLYGVERQSKMTPFAPMLGYDNGRQQLKGLVRSIISNVVDVRDPIQILPNERQRCSSSRRRSMAFSGISLGKYAFSAESVTRGAAPETMRPFLCRGDSAPTPLGEAVSPT